MFDSESLIIEGKRFPLGAKPEEVAQEIGSDPEIAIKLMNVEMQWHDVLNSINNEVEVLQSITAKKCAKYETMVKRYSRREAPPS